MDTPRLTWAIKAMLVASSLTDYQDLDEISEFLADEAELADVRMPEVVSGNDDADEKPSQHIALQYFLQELESLPLTCTLGPHLEDLLGIENAQVPIYIEAILDAYMAGPPVEIDDERPSKGGEGRPCELCDRHAVLTEHHLIPRSEHDLFIKRGVFTLQECRTRLAMVCRPCHSAIHRARSTRELAAEYNTVDKLLEIPEVARFAEWNSKRKVLKTVVQKRRRR